MSRLSKIKIKIGIANPMEEALAYIEQIVRYKEEWPIDRVMAIKKVMDELDKTMIELTNNSINPTALEDKEE
jgi:hypothetical protein